MRHCFFIAFITVYLNISGCAYLRLTSSTLPYTYVHKNITSKTLIIILPGINDNLDDFVENGVIDGLTTCRQDADVIYVDAHYGYYHKNILVKRLKQDIISQAMQRGVENIWFFGVSLGGYGSLRYRADFPDDIRGLILIAPFLGLNHDFKLFKKQSKKRYHLPEFYHFLSTLSVSAKQNPHIYMAYGTEDNYKKQHKWLANLLNPNQLSSKPGKHEWSTWNTLWPASLKKSGLCQIKKLVNH